MKTVTLAPHEYHANLLYNDDGLAPFFACDSAVKQAERGMGERGMGETMSSFIAWAARHGVDVDGARDARIRLRFGPEVENVKRALQEGFTVWTDAGLPEERYRAAQVRFADGSLSDAWRWLR